MPYTIYDAMQDEVKFLREMAKVEEKAGKSIVVAILESIANSHQRVLNRVNAGVDYSLEIVDGEIKSVHKKSDRKTLEQEYPVLKKLADQYNLLQNIIDTKQEKGSN